MTEDEYSALMKKALTNDLHWHALTATPPEARQARDWLEDTLARIRQDLEVRKSEWSLVTAREMRGSKAYKRELEKYETWKIKAIRFRSMCENRQRELKRSHLVRGGNAKPVALDRAQAHSEYMNRQISQVSTSLVRLTESVATFVAGELSVKELDARLDELTAPSGGDGSKTLRELLEASRKKRLEVVS